MYTGNVLSEEEKSIVFNFLLAIGVKSGRPSLLLDVVSLGVLDSFPDTDVNASLLSDLVSFVKEAEATAVPIPSRSKEFLALDVSKNQTPLCKYDASIDTTGLQLPANGCRHSLFSFGKPDHGKLGHGDAQIQRTLPTCVEALKGIDVVKLASMSTYSLAVDSKCVHIK